MINFTKILFLTLLLYTLQTLYPLYTYSQLVSDFRVNDDTTNAEQYSAKIGVDKQGNFTAVWTDKRNGRNNVFCQRFNSSAQFLGTNFEINVNPDTSLLPNIAVSENGNFAVCWLDVNNNLSIVTKVKCRIFNGDGIPLTNEILINDTLGYIYVGPSISVSNYNEYTITWEQKDILFQKLDSLGNKIGSNTKVNDDTGNNIHEDPAITVRQDGSFIITWQDSRPPATKGTGDIYMQIFTRNGLPQGSNVKVSDDTVLYNEQYNPKISSDTSGRFCISFTHFNLNEVHSNVMCQLYNSDGSRFGNNFTVAGSFDEELNSSIFKKENGDMVLGFNFTNGVVFTPKFQRINRNGIFIGGIYNVSTQALFFDKFYSDIVVWNDRIISVWSDVRNGNLDIYCNIRSFTNPDTIVNIQNISTELPGDFILFQNYPNPFNSQTQIDFQVSKNNNYSLEIFNTLGSLVDKVSYNNLNPGKYSIRYDASALSSGVYYYSVKSGSKGFNPVKKFVLLK